MADNMAVIWRRRRHNTAGVIKKGRVVTAVEQVTLPGGVHRIRIRCTSDQEDTLLPGWIR